MSLQAQATNGFLPDDYEAIKAAQNGDNDAMMHLIKTRIGLIHWMARRYPGDPEDVIQIAYLGFIRGVKSFDPSKEKQLNTYVVWWMRSALTKHLRHIRKHSIKRTSKINEIPDNPIPDLNDVDKIKQVMTKVLDPRSRTILDLTFYESQSGEQIGRTFGISRERVKQIRHRAIKRVREALNES